MFVLSHFSHDQLFATQWIVALTLPCPWDSLTMNLEWVAMLINTIQLISNQV